MPTGKIKWYDPRQGYGYIVPDDPGPELFVHQTELGTTAPPPDGASVEFQVKHSLKGPIALAVRLRIKDNSPPC